MNVVKLFIADELCGIVPEEATIEISEQLPQVHGGADVNWRDECEGMYSGQAILLANTLYESLPQGTYDRLIIELMRKKLSVYRGVTNS